MAGTSVIANNDPLHAPHASGRRGCDGDVQPTDGGFAGVALADILRQVGEVYTAEYGGEMWPSQRRAWRDILACRTEAMGGHLYACPDCGTQHYQYHSCRNRHCPQCQHDAGQMWLDKQRSLQLPVPYFLLTFTLPAELRPFARAYQRLLYNLLFRASATASQQLAQEPRFGGGQLGLLGVLHTWGRNLSYHPHVHYLVPAVVRLPNGRFHLLKHNFLLPVRALSVIFRAKMRDALRDAPFFDQIPASVWQQDWVVHCQPVGKGETALRYLAPYIFRVAISNRRILKCERGRVTFSYRQTDTGKYRTMTLAAVEFIRRFLQHVLPKGFVKVRYYGFLAPCRRPQLATLQHLLWLVTGCASPAEIAAAPAVSLWVCRCPTCGQEMYCVRSFRPPTRSPPDGR